MTNTDNYLFNAAETVRRKSLAALEIQSNAEAVMRSRAGGTAESEAKPDAALAEETERALALALAALEEIASQDGKESN